MTTKIISAKKQTIFMKIIVLNVYSSSIKKHLNLLSKLHICENSPFLIFMTKNPTISKPHYPILDGLRGVAAIIVVAYHLFEANAQNVMYQYINHGYLAVDFFFLLSGFVISYAYDDRWSSMTTGNFFAKRIERLQPMVILGMLIGALLFYLGDSAFFPEIHNIPLWQVLAVMLIGFTLIPLPPQADIRQWDGEMYPLNGAAWSLFYEYIANIAYALFLRRASTRILFILAIVTGSYLSYHAITHGDLIGGWSLTSKEIHNGLVRLSFPFIAGMLMARTITIKKFSNRFLLSSLLLSAILIFPRIGGEDFKWINGLYEALAVTVLFPLVIYLGASAKVGKYGSFCKTLGDLSYPLYITHIPLVYIYRGWISNNKLNPDFNYLTICYGIVTFFTALLMGYLAFRYYDEPVRKWIRKKITSQTSK